MKTLLRAAAATAALALSTSAHAQARNAPATTTTAGDKPQIGLGVGITSGDTGPAFTGGAPTMGYLLFVPINLNQFRIEPFIGWARSDTDFGGRASDFTMGIGGFLVQPVAAQLQLYAGGRLGSRWVSNRTPAGAKDERRDTLLALAAGGEYLPIPRVALGAEFQLGYVSIGDNKHTSAAGVVTETGGGSGTATQATLFARIYLF